jgi:predicted DNA-binding transcriptional regulator AlpA
MTLWRWLQDEELKFPNPILIKGRRYWRWSDLDAWDEAQAASSAEAA